MTNEILVSAKAIGESMNSADSPNATPSLDDSGLATRIRAREPAVLRAVVKQYLGHILCTARASGLGPQRAEEITQDTFTTFIEKAGQFEGRSHVRTWLFGILYKKILEASSPWLKPDGAQIHGQR